MRFFQTLFCVVGTANSLATGFVIAGPLKDSGALDLLTTDPDVQLTNRAFEPTIHSETPSISPQTCCPHVLSEIFGHEICGTELCTEMQTVTQLFPQAIDMDNPILEKREKDALCCFTSGILVFDCHFCYTTPPRVVRAIEADINQDDNQYDAKNGANSLDLKHRDSDHPSVEPCCVKGPKATPVYDCKLCRHGPQDAPPGTSTLFARSKGPEICCRNIEMVNPNCWMCIDKAFDASATIWIPVEVLKEDNSTKYVKLWSPPTTTTHTLGTRDLQGICCWPGTTTISLGYCWKCDLADPTNYDVDVWESQNGKLWSPQTTEDFRFEITEARGASGASVQVKVDRCCVVNKGVWLCFDCPSATSATEVSLIPRETATMTHAKRHFDDRAVQAGYRIEQCCYTNGMILYNCHICGSHPMGDSPPGVWQLETALDNGQAIFRDAPELGGSLGLSGDLEGFEQPMYCTSDNGPAKLLCQHIPSESMFVGLIAHSSTTAGSSSPTPTTTVPPVKL